jgi:hypothetical protein
LFDAWLLHVFFLNLHQLPAAKKDMQASQQTFGHFYFVTALNGQCDQELIL